MGWQPAAAAAAALAPPTAPAPAPPSAPAPASAPPTAPASAPAPPTAHTAPALALTLPPLFKLLYTQLVTKERDRRTTPPPYDHTNLVFLKIWSN